MLKRENLREVFLGRRRSPSPAAFGEGHARCAAPFSTASHPGYSSWPALSFVFVFMSFSSRGE
jgi:hypothetical protein